MTARLELGPIDVRPDPQQRLVAIGGFVVAIGSILSVLFVAIGLYITNEANREQQRLTAQGQITDRFTRAVEQLGQPGPEKVDVRLGSIYALERIMRDSAVDQPAVVDILAAFVRVHAARAPTAGARPRLPVDIQAALTVLGRRDITRDAEPIELFAFTTLDLTNTDLAGANLYSANLHGAKLTDAKLTDADLTRATLTRADLALVDLTGADLTLADLALAELTGANLHGADLTHANLTGAKLYSANLTSADLTLVDLTGANLYSANLTRADLTGANLTGANLTCARTDDRTRLPKGVSRPAPCG